MINIVFVDHDPEYYGDVSRYLSLFGMSVHRVSCGAEMESFVSSRFSGIVILNDDLPGEDAYSIAARLRQNRLVRVVMLSRRDTMDDKVLALSVGADAYLVMPVSMRELEAVIRCLHSRMGEEPEGKPLPAPRSPDAHWVFDSLNWLLISPLGYQTSLTNAEYQVLRSLTERAGQTVTRQSIASALGKVIGGYDDRSIDAVMTRLRRKVISATGESLPVRSVRSAGYVFAATVKIRTHADTGDVPMTATPGSMMMSRRISSSAEAMT
jgi:DNA-binding response OmpR family regulator